MEDLIIIFSLAKQYVLDKVQVEFSFLEEELCRLYSGRHGVMTARIEGLDEKHGDIRLQYHLATPDDPEGRKWPIEWERGPEWAVPISVCLRGGEEILRYIQEFYGPIGARKTRSA